jgi:hypothetical protein
MSSGSSFSAHVCGTKPYSTGNITKEGISALVTATISDALPDSKSRFNKELDKKR